MTVGSEVVGHAPPYGAFIKRQLAFKASPASSELALDDVVMQIDLRSPAGVSGVTQSMVSGWELGRHTTSITHRKTLCAIYGEPPEVLFAHQDELSNARANEGTTAICWNVVIAALNDLAQLSGRE